MDLEWIVQYFRVRMTIRVFRIKVEMRMRTELMSLHQTLRGRLQREVVNVQTLQLFHIL